MLVLVYVTWNAIGCGFLAGTWNAIGDNVHEVSKPIFWKNKKNIWKCCLLKSLPRVLSVKESEYEGESTSNQPNLFPVEIHLFFFDVIAL